VQGFEVTNFQHSGSMSNFDDQHENVEFVSCCYGCR